MWYMLRFAVVPLRRFRVKVLPGVTLFVVSKNTKQLRET